MYSGRGERLSKSATTFVVVFAVWGHTLQLAYKRAKGKDPYVIIST